MKLSIVIVSYNSSKNLERCLTALINQPKSLDLELYVIDNNSKDYSAEMVRRLFPTVSLIANKRNVGFGAACNQAIRQAKGESILLLNPDVFVQKNTLKDLLSYLRKNPDVGIITCKLLNPNGSVQHSRRRFPTPPVHFLKMLFPKSKLVSNYLVLDKDSNEVQEIDWALGAFLFVRRSVFRQIGLMDEQFFLYFEDTDLCYRAKQAGWKIIYYSPAVATHLYQQASHKLFSKPFFHHLKSMYLYYRKHGIKPNFAKPSRGELSHVV